MADVVFRANRSGDEIIELRSVAEAKYHGRIFLSGDLFEKVRRLRAGKERIGSADPLLRIIERSRKNLSGLHRPHVWAANQEVGADLKSRDSLRDLFGLVDAFFGQIALGIGWRFRILAVDSDAVADDIQLHLQKAPSIFVSNIVLRKTSRSVRESSRCDLVIDIETAQNETRRWKS
ncbi:MAG TPA: hypothetical protein VN933_00515 [Candidatus Eremiobacteraceae bacterium]|nr:hypothetical protein [Candidatus Eremiobacteraceae bacterium]